MTRSPGLRPCSIIHSSPDALAVVTARTCTLLSGADRVDRLHVLQLLHGPLRHQQRVLALVRLHANPAELAGQERVLRIGEARLQLERAGLRIHLVQRVLDLSLRGELGIVGQDEPQRKVASQRPLPPLRPGQVLGLRDLEPDPDGVERDDGGQRLGGVRGYQPADRNQRVADTAADRRANRAVLQVQIGGLAARLSATPPCACVESICVFVERVA